MLSTKMLNLAQIKEPEKGAIIFSYANGPDVLVYKNIKTLMEHFCLFGNIFLKVNHTKILFTTV